MSRAARVSICIPVYNASRHVVQTIESILAQDFEDREIVIVDDASTDDTWSKLQRYAHAPGVRLHRNPLNLGIGGNWNRCLELAAGEYLKYVHCDDICYPTCVSTLAEAAVQNPRAALIFCRRDFLLEGLLPTPETLRHLQFLLSVAERQETLHAGAIGGEAVLNAMFPDCCNVVGEPTATLLVRRVLAELGGFDPRFRQLIDVEAWVRILLRHDAVYIPNALCAWRVHPEQASMRSAFRQSVLPELALLYATHRQALKAALHESVFRQFCWSIWANLRLRGSAYGASPRGACLGDVRRLSFRDQGGAPGAIRHFVRHLCGMRRRGGNAERLPAEHA